MSCTIIIPTYRLSGLRLRNFNFTLDRILAAKPDGVIVVYQGSKFPLDKIKGVRYLLMDSDSEMVEKSRMINIGVMNSKTQFIWMNDADIVLPFGDVLVRLNDNIKFLQPFKRFVHLNKQDTQKFIENKEVTIEKTEFIEGFGAGSFVADRVEFMRIGGMDERYVGWGFEDMEFSARVSAFSDAQKMNKITGVHLYHEPEDSNLRNSSNAVNSRLYQKAKSDIRWLPKQYQKTIKSPFIENERQMTT